MPIIDEEEFDVEGVLKELDSKKQLLDLLIASLEYEVRTGEALLVTALQRALQDHHGPVTDLPSDAQSLLVHLVTRQRHGARGNREDTRKSSRRVA